MGEGRRLPFDVSRETLERLEHYTAELVRWTRAINLIAPSTAADVWQRHIVDCAQIVPFAPPETAVWCDLGAGAGLPGLVVAIIEREKHPARRSVLIESDGRKASFLKLQVRALGLKADVIQARIEQAPSVAADVVMARALAPVSSLLGFSMRHGRPDAASIFLKGRGFQAEIDEAARRYSFNLTHHQSLTDPEAAILVIENLSEKETAR